MARKKQGNQNQVPLAKKAGVVQPTQKKKRKKLPMPTYKKVAIIFLLTILIAATIFLVWGGIFVWKAVYEKPSEKIKVDPYLYTQTPEDKKGDVSYYVLGLFGEDKDSSSMDMLSIIMLDKTAKSANILQVPADTYLGKDGPWNTTKAADVWAKPKPLKWCETDKKIVQQDEIDKEEKHITCGGIITEKRGSASGDLGKVFNMQLGIPVDEYIIFEHQTLVKLVDQIGGIDVELEGAMTVEKVTYPEGVQTLDGQAALTYALKKGDGVKGDIDRLVRQRKVFLALFQRLGVQGIDLMTKNSIGPIMSGETPIRTSLYRKELIELIDEYKNIQLKNVKAYVLPGTVTNAEKRSVYSINKGELLTLVNSSFRAHLSPIKEDALSGTADIAGGSGADLREQTMIDIAVSQSGVKESKEKEETTTTSKAS